MYLVILLVKFSLDTFKLVDIINEDNWKEICILILSLCELCLRVAVACFLSHMTPPGYSFPNATLELICTP